ncbi:MAG: glycoside hydrolase family 32 protein [Kiritimatiellaeota bacterium]|nr:glycoside hydrolase family 32 protein [Kiritimatiellota bacterium]
MRRKVMLGILPVLATVLLSPTGTYAKPQTSDTTRREKTFTVENKYLVMPIQNKGKGNTVIHLSIDGKEVRRYKLQAAPSAGETDWYAFFTIENYKGKQARVEVERATEEGFALIRPSDTIPGEENFYKEPHRPQFHFSQKVGWNNDPNGMVWHDGKWHLFFQHNPTGLAHGNMTWGHATSTDLVHWKQQGDKLFPATMAAGSCFSGGGTVDKMNTAGWGKNALVLFFTDTSRGEAVAYSTDGGDTFTYYEGNPVVKHKGRDPKVIWYAYDEGDTPLDDKAKDLGGHWVMVVYDEHPQHGRNAAFYTSTNLKDWTEQSHLPGYFECTELFELPVDPPSPGGYGATGGKAGTRPASSKDSAGTRWVIFAADARYAIGRFDGKVFTPDHKDKYQVHWGPYYASQTFDNAPDGRKIQMAWLKIHAPTGPFNQYFSFPHELTLRTTADGIRMFAKPVKEIETLRAKSHRAEAQDLVSGKAVTVPVGSDSLDVRLTVEVGTANRIVLELPGRSVGYDVKGQKLNNAPLAPVDGPSTKLGTGRISIQVLADRWLTEIIGNDGRVCISGGGPAKIEAGAVSVTAQGGNAKLLSLEAHELKSIWEN